jgi:23S rRNA (guanine2445-N2)-methyltransferase / 23S rRNA (guanine2069-N7)-methyltransferase
MYRRWTRSASRPVEQRFKLDPALVQRYSIRDISAATLPRNFERNPRIHRCFEVRRF